MRLADFGAVSLLPRAGVAGMAIVADPDEAARSSFSCTDSGGVGGRPMDGVKLLGEERVFGRGFRNMERQDTPRLPK